MNAQLNTQKATLFEVVESMAKQQLIFLMSHYKMGPEEIIHLYTGDRPDTATYEAALHAIIAHRTTAEFNH